VDYTGRAVCAEGLVSFVTAVLIQD
jgi:hypothetical protein